MNNCLCTLREDKVRCIPKTILTYLTQIFVPYRNQSIDLQRSVIHLTGFYMMGILTVWLHLLFYKERAYKQLALGWQITKQFSGLTPI